MNITYPNGYQFTNVVDTSVWAIVSLLVALCVGIVLYFTFLNPKNAEHYTGATKKIYDFLSFKVMSLETILKICYLVFAIYITISSFSLISIDFIYFLLYLFIGNIVVRLIFEGALLILMIHKELAEVNSKLSKDKKSKEEK